MRIVTICVLGAAMVTAACGAVDTCDEPERYESAEGGKRVQAPEGLDELQSGKELVIPSASPRPPRDRSEGCLDRPPSLRVGPD